MAAHIQLKMLQELYAERSTDQELFWQSDWKQQVG